MPPPCVDAGRFAAPPWDQYVYNGEVALTPTRSALVGFSGGEYVEIHGHLLTEATNDAFSGRWYVADSIRIWEGQVK